MSQTSKPDPHAVLDNLLPAAVREATGRPDVEPRPGQVQLSHEIMDRMLAVGEPSRSASDVATQSLAGAPTGSGKALALDTPIPTPDGWTTMGELEVGDYVLDHLGAPTLVTSVSDVQTDRTCFEVRVGDGAPVVADAEHLWPVLGLPAHHGSLAERVADDLGVSADSMWDSQVVAVLAEQQAYSQTLPYRTLTTTRLAEVIGDGDTPCGLRSDTQDMGAYRVRPVDSVPVRCIMVDSPARLFRAGPSGLVTHNSLAYLTPLFLDAVTAGHRAVVSTESLSLQSQIVDKDAPAVARAVEKVLHTDPPTFAILKGWSNYGCVSRAAGTVAQLLDLSEDGQDASTVPNLLSSLDALIARGDQESVQVDDREYDPRTLLPLTKWVLESATAPDATGDRDSYPGNRSTEDWQQVSVTPDDCVGAARCPFASVCLPKKAQEEAAAADVVVTNHAMLAVQAANNVPVVLGSNKLGIFDHLVIDEAHALPSIVRGAGARSISAATVMRLVRILHRHCATNESAAAGEEVDREAQGLVDLGEGLAVSVDKTLDRKIADQRRKSRHGAAVIGVDPDDEAPLGELGDSLETWARRILRALPVENPTAPLPPTQAIALNRARADVSRFISDLEAVLTHKLAHARWIQDGDPTRRGRWMGASLRSSPVDVAGDISNNLFTADVVRDQDDDANPWGKVSEHRWVSDEDPVTKRPPRYRLSATAVSATLPKSFAFDTGMAVKAKPYPSPFMDAYEGSALYIPMVKDLDDAAGFTKTWPGARRPSFDTARHPEWAVGQIVKLVSANGGRALILAATVSAGQRYAETLRVMMPGLTVFSQWDGRPVRHVLAQWRDDETSVMVGTKSLMTGVDAPGQTCSLVILDRVPRDAGNPVDDARVEAVMERGGMDKWAADRHVYVADAALRVDQASGRLIRCVSQDTELLTTEGWKRYDEVHEGMTIYGVAPEDMARNGRPFAVTQNGAPLLREHRVTGVVVNDEPEPVISIKGKSLDSLVTPDHNVLIQKHKVNYRSIGSKNGMRTYQSNDMVKVHAEDLPSRFKMPLAGRVVRKRSKLPRDWFTLIGLICTDGHVSQVKATVSLAQSTAKPAVVAEIDDLLTRMDLPHNRYVQPRNGTSMSVRGGPVYTRNGDMVSWVFTGSSAARIRDVLLTGQRRRYSASKAYRGRSHRGVDGWKDVERSIPRWLLQRASRPDMLAFLRGLMLGDGSGQWLHDGSSGAFYTGVESEADKFQELMALIGFRSVKVSRSATHWEIKFCASGSVSLNRSESVTDGGLAKTWCVSTELGNMVMRRNGRTFITGNSGSDRGMFALLDPRMLKFGVVTYAEPTRRALMEPLADFGTKIARLDQALDWLAELREAGGSSPLAS